MQLAETKPAVRELEDSTAILRRGTVIPAHPLALDAAKKLDEKRQRALSRYYLAAGAGGLAVGVHTTQFQIHEPECGLLEPVLALAAEEMNNAEQMRSKSLVRVAGICGSTSHAVKEAELAVRLGYQYGLVSLAALKGASTQELLDHCLQVAEVIQVFGFYLQPDVGGIELPLKFWRGFCEIDNVAAIKIAAFNRYRTLAVIRAVAESGRDDIALYTGNDDNIVFDLISPYRFNIGGRGVERRFVGGLLGQWAVWTSRAVQLLEDCRTLLSNGGEIPSSLLKEAVQLTDANAAIFDATNSFAGCISGIHEILRRQGLLVGNWCLDEREALSPGQAQEIDRVLAAYPNLQDDQFVAANIEGWMSG